MALGHCASYIIILADIIDDKLPQCTMKISNKLSYWVMMPMVITTT